MPAGLLERSPRGPEEPCHAVPAPSVDLAPRAPTGAAPGDHGTSECSNADSMEEGSPSLRRTADATHTEDTFGGNDGPQSLQHNDPDVLLGRRPVVDVAAHRCEVLLKLTRRAAEAARRPDALHCPTFVLPRHRQVLDRGGLRERGTLPED